MVDCNWTVVLLQMQDSKNFGWEINGDINFNWKKLLENKVSFKSLPWLWAHSAQLLTLKECHIAQGSKFFPFLQTKEIVRLNGVHQKILTNAGVTLIEGAGSLVDVHTVEVSQPDGSKQRYTAKHILIATGSRAQRVNIPGKVCKIPHLPFVTKTCTVWLHWYLRCWRLMIVGIFNSVNSTLHVWIWSCTVFLAWTVLREPNNTF